MSQTLRDQLARGAEAVGRPTLDVPDLVAQAERRLVRRRLGAVAAVAAAVAVITTAGLTLRTDDRTPSPAPPPPTISETPATPPAGPAIYFDALAVEGEEITDPVRSIQVPKDIYITGDGARPRQVVATGASEECPEVSPDGSMLAYLEGGRTVVVLRLEQNGDAGATIARVELDAIEAMTCPQWSPDGRRLAVATSGYSDPEQFLEVRVIDLDGTQRLLVTRRAQQMPLPDLTWSPEGDAIAFTTPDAVRVAPLRGGGPTIVWRGPAPQAPSSSPAPGTPRRVSWLATGELAVSALARYTDVGQDETLHIVDPGSGREQEVGTFAVSEPTAWSWSPDGSRLVFADSDGTVQLFDRANGRTVPVRPRLEGRDIPVWKVVWSADGRRLVGTAADTDPSTVVFGLVSMRPRGSAVEVLTPWTMALYSEADVSWSPR